MRYLITADVNVYVEADNAADAEDQIDKAIVEALEPRWPETTCSTCWMEADARANDDDQAPEEQR